MGKCLLYKQEDPWVWIPSFKKQSTSEIPELGSNSRRNVGLSDSQCSQSVGSRGVKDTPPASVANQ